MEFRTSISVSPSSEKIDHKSPVLMLGSCFSDNVGELLKERRFPILANPFGVLYNPFSISVLLKRCLKNELLTPDEVFEEKGIFKSFLFHSSFAAESKKEFIAKANAAIQNTSDFLKKTYFLILTFGTARYYRLNENNCIVANCHKQPAAKFTEVIASVDDCEKEISDLINDIRKINPGVFIIFTISPVRYLKDGVPGAQTDKAVLFCALEKWLKIPGTFYFPSYEIMMDELRDYRFYNEDMVHPTAQAVEYIYEKFGESFFTNETQKLSDRIKRITTAAAHRPMFPESSTYREFREKIKKEIEELKKDWPEISI